MYRAGDAVQILWGQNWFPGRIVREVDAASWEIAYDGWDASWNEVVGADRLLVKGQAPPAPPPPPPKPPVVLDGPLEGAASVAWDALEHAYGAASDVPECLSALRSADGQLRDDAISHLGNALDHQGIGRGPATLAATPFLLRLLDDPSVPGRAEIANLLADFAVGDTWWFLYYGFHPAEQTNVDHRARPKASVRGSGHRSYPNPGRGMDMTPGRGLLEIYEAVEAGMPGYLRALDDDDATLRASAAHVLSFMTRHGDRSCPPLARRLARDPDPAVRASAALSLSHAAYYTPSERARATSTLMEAFARAATPLERRALAVAIARYEDESLSAQVRPALVNDLEAGVPPLAPAWPFPWRRLDSAWFVFNAGFYGSAMAERPKVAIAAAKGLARVTDECDASDVASDLAFCSFGPPQPGVVPKLEDADAEVRILLDAIATAPLAWTYSDLPRRLEPHGLPYTQEAFAAWVRGA